MATKRPTEQSISPVQVALMGQDITYIKKTLDDLKGEVEGKYVTVDQLEPIKKIVYGLVGTVLLCVATAVMAVVLRQKQ